MFKILKGYENIDFNIYSCLLPSKVLLGWQSGQILLNNARNTAHMQHW